MFRFPRGYVCINAIFKEAGTVCLTEITGICTEFFGEKSLIVIGKLLQKRCQLLLVIGLLGDRCCNNNLSFLIHCCLAVVTLNKVIATVARHDP